MVAKDRATPRTIEHYFDIKRGTWVVDANGKKTQYSEGGLSYIGNLTEAAKLGLDELINEYIAKETAKTQQETEDVCAHRYYKTHCRICRIAQLERELAEARAALEQIDGTLVGSLPVTAEVKAICRKALTGATGGITAKEPAK